MTSKQHQITHVTQYTKAELETISPDTWKHIINKTNHTTLLKCLEHLIELTDNAKKDRIGLSLVDDTRSHDIRDELILNPKRGSNLKKAVLLLYKYRIQLWDIDIEFPDCLFFEG
jgi:hypothetical protein